jgi:hypothetical protein
MLALLALSATPLQFFLSNAYNLHCSGDFHIDANSLIRCLVVPSNKPVAIGYG